MTTDESVQPLVPSVPAPLAAPAGWYARPDGTSAWWNGAVWASAPARESGWYSNPASPSAPARWWDGTAWAPEQMPPAKSGFWSSPRTRIVGGLLLALTFGISLFLVVSSSVGNAGSSGLAEPEPRVVPVAPAEREYPKASSIKATVTAAISYYCDSPSSWALVDSNWVGSGLSTPWFDEYGYWEVYANTESGPLFLQVAPPRAGVQPAIGDLVRVGASDAVGRAAMQSWGCAASMKVEVN
jgi:hypothetical protein